MLSKTRHAGQNGLVVRIRLITVQFMELAEQVRQIVASVGTLRMAGQLCDLPGRQVREDVLNQCPPPTLQALDLGVEIQVALRPHMAEFADLCVQFGNRLFEVEKIRVHGGEKLRINRRV